MAKDPTLFTATAPIASAKPTPRNTRIAIGGPAPPGETPHEKVARLREAARKARLSNESPAERIIERGRVWADRAHRFTTLSLIGFTAIAGVVVAVSLGDMVIHNRRKRNEWYEVQTELRRRDLVDARQALAQGMANEDQMLLINQERAREEAEFVKANKKGLFTRAKESVFGTTIKEEQRGGTLGIKGFRDKSEELGVVKAVEQKVAEGKEKAKMGLKSAEEKIQAQTSRPTVGGPLDQLGEQAAEAAVKTTKSWTDWALRR